MSSLADGTRSLEPIKIFYEHAVKFVAESAEWEFATQVAVLDGASRIIVDSSIEPNFFYVYNLPVKDAYILSVTGGRWAASLGQVYSNEQRVSIEYLHATSENVRFTEQFREAVSLMLASLVAPAYHLDVSEVNSLRFEARTVIKKQGAREANKRKPRNEIWDRAPQRDVIWNPFGITKHKRK